MITITLQEDEAENVERLLDLILTNKQASQTVFESGAQRRSVVRASKKLHWAKMEQSE
tara:strand:- start:83 stop:256 length:174 start_codon:yes stop_codon:yes gene_type:complete